MGDLVVLDPARLRARASSAAAAAVAGPAPASVATLVATPRPVTSIAGITPSIREFYFDLACPFSYLAAERVERLLGQVDWVPVAREAVSGQAVPSDDDRMQCELQAEALRLPLSWPDFSAAGFPSGLRAAAYAGESRAAGRFALAGLRLAFCGGYDLEDPEILAEAAAAAGLGFDACLTASQDSAWDCILDTASLRLRHFGVDRLPAFRIGDRWFAGEQGLAEAAAALRNGVSAGVGARVPA